MSTRIEIQPSEDIEETFVSKIRDWANEVLERKEDEDTPPFLSITVWKTIEDLKSFYLQEQAALGVGTSEDTGFLATHEAWRGYPRIHICQERVAHVPDAVIQGVLHHEISHALLHGTPEFYTFRYTNRLQEAGRDCGLDWELLQQCVYLLSVAVKDFDVVTYLAGIGLGQSQLVLINYLISDTDEERRIWSMVAEDPAKRKLAIAVFLKTLIPIEAMISNGVKGAEEVREQWKEAYGWLSERVQEGLARFLQHILMGATMPFQERLEQATLQLLADSSL